jgi:predicted nuclease of predicted toxin-antitoxin system
MKIKLNENLLVRLASVLIELGHDVHTTQEEGLTGSADPQIWDAAQREQRFLITQDLDFSDTRLYVPGLTAAFCWCVSIRRAASV